MSNKTTSAPAADAVGSRLDRGVVPLAPKRVQLSRAKGWHMPPNTVKVDRSTRWGNPCYEGMFLGYTVADAVRDFERYVTRDPCVRSFENRWGPPPELAPLRGKNLACWCKLGQPCHADVLLRLANDERHNVLVSRQGGADE